MLHEKLVCSAPVGNENNPAHATAKIPLSVKPTMDLSQCNMRRFDVSVTTAALLGHS